MTTLEQAIRSLRRELAAAMSGDADPGTESPWRAEHASVSLALRLNPSTHADTPARFEVATEPDTALHRLTVEFRRTPDGNGGITVTRDATSSSSAESATPEVPPTPPLLRALSEVFGSPGFDSSARATVFRECLEALDPPDRRHCLLALDDAAKGGKGSKAGLIAQARHRIARLAASGPSGADRGPTRLRQLADDYSPEELIEAAAVHWRTPSDWAADSTPDADV